jgi:hypothetical protein
MVPHMKLVILGFVMKARRTVKDPKKRVDIDKYGKNINHL